MATPPSEKHAAGGPADLIRDIGRSMPSPGTPATPEQQLMRLSSDPLLVRDFIQSLDPGSPLVRTAPPLRSETAIAMASAGAGGGPTHAGGGSPRQGRYERRNGLSESTVFPFAFRASLDDRREALDHAREHDETGQVHLRYEWILAAVIFTSVLGLLLVLLLPG